MAKLSTPSHPCETVSPTWTIDNKEVGKRWIGNIPCRYLAYRRTDGRWLCRSCARAVRSGQVRHTAASAAAYLPQG